LEGSGLGGRYDYGNARNIQIGAIATFLAMAARLEARTPAATHWPAEI
jgi:hypothetical protein